MTSDSRHFQQSLQSALRELGELPVPDKDALARSGQLSAEITQAITANGGVIGFEQFMEMALYAPDLGYYCAPQAVFGEHGDFITSPEISLLFGQCLAQQCAEILPLLHHPVLIEAGAGSGQLMATLLLELEAMGALPETCWIVETSSEMQMRQRLTLEQNAAHLLERVHWYRDLPDTPVEGILIANELLDALPVHLFQIREGRIHELGVGLEEDGFAWKLMQARPEWQSHIPTGDFMEGYRSEINSRAGEWIRQSAKTLSRGAALIIDYGYPAREYYLPRRHQGTLMCYYRHRAHDNPLVLVGLQDITAFVDFTAVARAAVQSGFDVAGFTTQAGFLMSLGLDQRIARAYAENPDPQFQINLAQQVKKLTLPHEMGELFKVMALTKSLVTPITGFTLSDQRGRL